MVKIFDYIVVGCGATGISVVAYLESLKQQVGVVDDRQQPPAADMLRTFHPKTATHFGDFNVHWQADTIVLSPGIAPEIFADKYANREIIGDIELFARHCQTKVIAITGTNGKSTLVALIEHASQQAGIKSIKAGNIGNPILNIQQTEIDYVILEASSFQLEATYSLRPKVALITNITPDHLDRHEKFEQYVATKQRIFRHAKWCIINADDKRTRPLHKPQMAHLTVTNGKPKTQSQLGVVRTAGRHSFYYGKRWLCDSAECMLAGEHNYQAILTAFAVAILCDWPLDAYVKGVQCFPGLAHRMQQIGVYKGIRYINDSKATNVGATIFAIKALCKDTHNKAIILLLGGDGKNADFTKLAHTITNSKCQSIVYGTDTSIDVALNNASANFKRTRTLLEAVITASKQATPGDVVLLSPACASFDQFDNFEQRGDAFIDYVHTLARDTTEIKCAL